MRLCRNLLFASAAMLSIAFAQARASVADISGAVRPGGNGGEQDVGVALRAGLLAKLKPRRGLHPSGGHP